MNANMIWGYSDRTTYKMLPVMIEFFIP